MKLSFLKILTIVGILFANLYNCKCAPGKRQDKSLADNYTALTEDVKWFFRGINKIASTMDQMLPNASTDLANTRTFSENARITLLAGLRHLLVGVREIAITFEKNFSTDHVKQLCQLKTVTNFINDVFYTLKMWFSQIRAIALHFLLLYNRYVPEVLFGKCLGNYLVATYPERSFYEYPVILLTEMYSSITANLKTEPTEATDLSTELTTLDPLSSLQQNEISNSDLEDSQASYRTTSGRHMDADSLSFASFFDFSTVLNADKDEIIESAAKEQSWQICLKLYTAESISRSLKNYFLGL